MVLKGVFNSIFTKSSKAKNRPMLNEIPWSSSTTGMVGLTNSLASKRRFWEWFKSRPELMAPVTIRVIDTIGDVEFTDIDGSPLGRNKLLTAQKFWNDNQMQLRLRTMQFDRLVTGSGFIWKGNALNQTRTLQKPLDLDKIMTRSGLALEIEKEIQIRELDRVNAAFKRVMDEDIRKTRKIDILPSSTVTIRHDAYDIQDYVQNLGGNTEVFKPEDIIHIPLYTVDGKVDGFTPVETLVYELIFLWTIKENMLAFFRNGNWSGKIFTLPEEISNSENHKWLMNELANKGILENRHGHLVLTGKVEIEDWERKMEDLQYENLLLYVKSNIAYALGVPLNKVADFLGKNQSSDAGGIADGGYTAMIESDQTVIEMFLNPQLCNPLGFNVRFKKKSKIDTVKEAQALTQRLSALPTVQNSLKMQGLKLKQDKLLKLLSGCEFNITNEDVEEMSPEEMMMQTQATGSLNQKFLKDKEVNPNKAQQNKAAVKKQAAENNPKGRPQNGV